MEREGEGASSRCKWGADGFCRGSAGGGALDGGNDGGCGSQARKQRLALAFVGGMVKEEGMGAGREAGQRLGQVKGRAAALGAALMASGVATALSPSARRVVACGGAEAQQRCRQGRSKAVRSWRRQRAGCMLGVLTAACSALLSGSREAEQRRERERRERETEIEREV